MLITTRLFFTLRLFFRFIKQRRLARSHDPVLQSQLMASLESTKRYLLRGHEDQGTLYLLVPPPGGIGETQGKGILVTREAFLMQDPPYAGILLDGRILRFGKQIGTEDDLIEQRGTHE
jgi:hypothetical protein